MMLQVGPEIYKPGMDNCNHWRISGARFYPGSSTKDEFFVGMVRLKILGAADPWQTLANAQSCFRSAASSLFFPFYPANACLCVGKNNEFMMPRLRAASYFDFWVFDQSEIGIKMTYGRPFFHGLQPPYW
jgi:hypothetical protein